jgi:hypothetical protein
MTISNCGVNNALATPQAQVETAPASGNQSASNPTPNPSTYTPSLELTRLLDQVRVPLDVRQDRVQAAAARVQQGYYNGQSSIEQTAQAMIQPGG